MIGGGDVVCGMVLKVKMVIEVEIVFQGLCGCSQECIDVMEDLLMDVGIYVLQVCLCKIMFEEVQCIVGVDVLWLVFMIDEIFEMVNVIVCGGLIGKFDCLQDQDCWIKLQLVIQQIMMMVVDLYLKGQVQFGQVLVVMLCEMLVCFDEWIDFDQFLLQLLKDGELNLVMLMQENQMFKV